MNSGFSINVEDCLTSRWQSAKSRCTSQLRMHEIQQAARIQTPEDCKDDLDRLGRSSDTEPGVSPLIPQFYPLLSTLGSVVQLLGGTEPPLDLDTNLFFGVLHLAITAAAIHPQQILVKLCHMSDRICRKLDYFQRCASSMIGRIPTVVRDALVDVLVTFLPFWTSASMVLRDTQVDRIEDKWPQLDRDFDETAGMHHDTIENLDKHVKLELALQTPSNPSTASSTPIIRAHSTTFESIEHNQAVFPCHNLPPKPAYFYGRDGDLDRLEQCFRANNNFLAADELSSVVLHGPLPDHLLGQRTRIARRSGLLFSLLQALGVDVTAEETARNPATLIFGVKTWLERTKRSWLLIPDNVEDPELVCQSLPGGNGRVLLTTRYRWLGIQMRCNAAQEVGPLDPPVGLDMFVGLCQRFAPDQNRQSELAEIEKVLGDMGCLALGIEQVAAYVSYRSMSIDMFRQQYARSPRRIHAHNLSTHPNHCLVTLWEVQFGAIQDKPAAEVLGLLSLLSGSTIPLAVLSSESDMEGEIPQIMGFDEDVLHDSLDRLMRLALIKIEIDQISVHRLVQRAFLVEANLGTTSTGLQHTFNIACQLSVSASPSPIPAGAGATLGSGTSAQTEPSSQRPEVDWLSVNIRKQLLDPRDGQLANTYSNKALLEVSSCRYDEALRFLDLALETRKRLKNNYLPANYIFRGMIFFSVLTMQYCHLFWTGNLALKKETNSIAELQNNESERLRTLWMMAVALRSQPSITEDEEMEALRAEKSSKDGLDTFLKDKGARLHSLSEDDRFSVLVCAERR
ncbi:hypothetical protein QBC35DRAFT_535909 [Podospora australis]|uniref:Uncharacterized protein n=1 Tax=Podospora australis TaxID=1536484 RepID=A0AAN6WJS0_9PEZI|nr:hypothetical protein QBC35DRAFT_535909 [Podospora australis]